MLDRTTTKLPYLSADDLGINQWEYDSLVAFVEAAPTMKWVKAETAPPDPDDFHFDMNTTYHRYRECGSVGCIGGWVYKHANPKAGWLETSDYVDQVDSDNDTLYRLYFPAEGIVYDYINPRIASETIQHFLRTGQIEWKRLS